MGKHHDGVMRRLVEAAEAPGAPALSDSDRDALDMHTAYAVKHYAEAAVAGRRFTCVRGIGVWGDTPTTGAISMHMFYLILLRRTAHARTSSYEALPRLLSIFFDYPRRRAMTQRTMTNLLRYLNDLRGRLRGATWLIALPQLVSRIAHKYALVALACSPASSTDGGTSVGRLRSLHGSRRR